MDERDPRAREAEIEQALTDALARRLPQHPASYDLKRRLAAQVENPDTRAASTRSLVWRLARQQRLLVPALVAVLLLAVVLSLYPGPGGRARGTRALVAEAVNDHVRVVALDHRLPVESGGIHQVKPWFTGRLDFAPAIAFAGDDEFPLKGGAIEPFLDRRAGIYVFTHRLHSASVLVVRAEGLRWPRRGTQPVAGHPAEITTARGFNVIVWREGDLGYLVVSDMDRPELLDLAARIAGGA